MDKMALKKLTHSDLTLFTSYNWTATFWSTRSIRSSETRPEKS